MTKSKNCANPVFKILIILFLAFITSVIVSCQNKENELIDTTTSPIGGGDTTKAPIQDSIAFLKSTKSEYGSFTFTYDAQNHVIKMSEFDATGKFISDPYEFKYSGNKLVTSIDKLNGDKEYIYTYTGDLITKVTLTTGGERYFTYDINKNLILFIGKRNGILEDTIVYEGYINNRPTLATQYKFNKDGTINNTVKRRYTYDADNNLTKVEFLNTKYYTTWRLDAEYFYDLKIPNINPKMPFGNVNGIEGGIYGNPNPDSKDINTYLANRSINYTPCLDVDKYSRISTAISTKKDPKGLPLELQGQSELYDKCTGIVSKTINSKTELKYVHVKK